GQRPTRLRAQLPTSPGPCHIRHAAQPAERPSTPPATQETGRSAPRRPSEPGRSNRPAVPHHRGQRQRGGAPLRLGQRRPDRRRAQIRGFPDRDRVGSYRGTAQGPGTLHHQGPPGPGHRHRGQALGRPYPQRRSGAISLTDRPAAKPTPQFSYQSGSWTRSFLLTSPSEQPEITLLHIKLFTKFNDKIGILSLDYAPRRTWPGSCTCDSGAARQFFLPFFLCSARTHRPRETVAVSQARCLGFSDFLPIPTLRTNRYDCSERSSLLRSRLIARRHLYGTGSDRMIMTDLPDHRWDSGLVLRMAQGLLGRIARHGVSTIWLRQRQGRRRWQRQRPVLGRGRQRARRPPAATEPRGRTLAAGRYPA